MLPPCSSQGQALGARFRGHNKKKGAGTKSQLRTARPNYDSKRRIEGAARFSILALLLIERSAGCWISRSAGRRWKIATPARAAGFFMGSRRPASFPPGCTSRLPLRKNTLFFATTAQAEAAGLRPCKRCRPLDPSMASRHVAAIEKGLRADPHERGDPDPRPIGRRRRGSAAITFTASSTR